MIWTPAMVAYWNFSALSGSPSQGAAAGAQTFGGGFARVNDAPHPWAAEFGGGRVEFSERVVPAPEAGFTIGFWINPQDHGAQNGFVLGNASSSGDSGVRILISTSNDLLFAYGKGTTGDWAFNLSAQLTVGQWQHVCATYDETSQRATLFLGGIEQAVGAPVTLPAGASENLAIGERRNNTLPLQARLAALGIWRGGADAADVRQIMMSLFKI